MLTSLLAISCIVGGANRQKSYFRKGGNVSGVRYGWHTPERGLTSTELTDKRRAIEVWLIGVPMVGWGGLVGPWVPVAMTPSGSWA